MDVLIEAVPMGAAGMMTSAVVTAILHVFAAVAQLRPASIVRSILSIGGVSLSAVSPDHNLRLGGSAAA